MVLEGVVGGRVLGAVETVDGGTVVEVVTVVVGRAVDEVVVGIVWVVGVVRTTTGAAGRGLTVSSTRSTTCHTAPVVRAATPSHRPNRP